MTDPNPHNLPVHNPEASQTRQERENTERELDDEARLVAQMERAYELHVAGVGYRQIAKDIGEATTTTYRMVQKYIKAHAPIADPGTYAAEHLAELALQRRRIHREALAASQAGESWAHARASMALLKIQEREDKLTRRDVLQGDPDELDGLTDEELADVGVG